MDLIIIDTCSLTSILTGILYLLVFIAGVLSIARAVDHPGYLTKAALNSGQVKRAAFFQFFNGCVLYGNRPLTFSGT
ncbi:MAG: hypothetical protein HC905_01950 [Bacteroidales bacterium]|nr:hypothetical protein [Bacteroidales bacterium]